jgi:serine/threonine protein kinase
LGLSDLHNKQIIHCNIKPENIILDGSGYAYIADLSHSKKKGEKLTSNELHDNCCYIAPEVFLKGHTLVFAADYFSIGVLLHELLFGEAPNQNSNLKELKEFFVSQELAVNEDYSQEITEECINFMNELFEKKYKNRLGYEGGLNELKEHSWFDGFNWEELESKEMVASFIPSSSKDNFNSSLHKELYMNQIRQIQTQPRSSSRSVASQYYNNYSYIRNDDNNNNKHIQKPKENDNESSNTSNSQNRNKKKKKLHLLQKVSSSSLELDDDSSSSRSNEIGSLIDKNDAYLPSNIKRNSLIINSPTRFNYKYSNTPVNNGLTPLHNYNNFVRKHKRHSETTLPKIISPKRSTGLPSIVEETNHNHNHNYKHEYYPFVKNKFFNYNIEDHLQNEENIVSPFKYAADQIQSNVSRHSLNKRKTIKSNDINSLNIDDETVGDLNLQLQMRQRRNAKNKTTRDEIRLRSERRRSFFDFTSSIN